MAAPYVRVVRFAWAAAMAAAALVPVVAAWPGMPWRFRILLIVIGASSALRPATGVVAIAVTLPLAVPLAALLGTGLTTTGTGEACLLVFLAGGAFAWAASASASRLGRPAIALAVLVVISMAFEVRQWQRQYPVREIGREVAGAIASAEFLRGAPDFPEIHTGLRWLEGLALAVLVERALRRRVDMQPVAVTTWLVAGAGAASLAGVRLLEVSLRQPVPLSAALKFLETQRVTTLQPDFNAAGSYFALFLVAALIIGVGRRRWLILATIVPVTALALMMTQSLAAVLAVVVVGGLLAGTSLWRAGHRAWLAIGAAALLVMIAGAWAATRSTHAPVGAAAYVRVEMSRVALRMAMAHPVFGVGVGKFALASRQYVSPGLVQAFPPAAAGENAHDNFLQVLAELGVPGLIAFLAVIAAAVWPGPAAPAHGIERAGLIGGLAAFGVSALLGHPLLVAEISSAFFLALGLAAGLAGAPPPAKKPVRA